MSYKTDYIFIDNGKSLEIIEKKSFDGLIESTSHFDLPREAIAVLFKNSLQSISFIDNKVEEISLNEIREKVMSWYQEGMSGASVKSSE